ncbi:MAG: CYTH domain-containing protein [Microcystaceae cyanobacterium]
MAIEIERKFLVIGDQWRNLGKGKSYRQGYIRTQNPDTTVRIRIAGDQGYLTLKGKKQGVSRAEFEYPIPLADATPLLETLCDRPLIEKTRYHVVIGEVTWEIDEFWGENEGLIVAEIELETDNQVFEKPKWIGKEVTHDFRYYNSNLVKNPYQSWKAP